MPQPVKVLAWLNIVLGVLGMLGACVALLVMLGTAGVIGFTADGPDAGVAVAVLSLVGGFVFVLCAFLSLPSIAAGAGLLAGRPWAWPLTFVLSVLHLLNVPIGTCVGAYGIWVLAHHQPPVEAERPRAVA